VTRLRTGRSRFSSQQGPSRPGQHWCPPTLLSSGYRGALTPGIKQKGREADHSPASSDKVKNAWSYTSTPPNVYIAWCLIKQEVRLHYVVRAILHFYGYDGEHCSVSCPSRYNFRASLDMEFPGH
jgi:hypothetical protein